MVARGAVNFVALIQKKFCQVGSVLAGDSDNECFFHNDPQIAQINADLLGLFGLLGLLGLSTDYADYFGKEFET